MIDREEIGLRISVLRKKAGLSQAELAEKLGISAQAVSKWESGKNLPDIDIFCELAWLFNTSIDTMVRSELFFGQDSARITLPANVNALIQNSERRKFLESLAPYCSDLELYNIAKEMAAQNLKLSLAANVEWRDKNTDTTALISPEALGEKTLREIAPWFAKALGDTFRNTDPGLRRIENLLRCPVCGKPLSLKTADENIYFICENEHRYNVTDGVIDFGSREIPGETWSLYFRNYDDYLREQRHPGNPRYQMGEVPCSEVRWQEIKKLRPRVILDAACGTCNGLKYDLQRINWPCLVIMTDLSHRVLKYNKRYFSEEMVNPYVDIVCIACDCADLPITDGCIDAVVSNAGFESMQTKMMNGFGECCRVLKKGSSAIYNMSILDDRNSENTKKWLRLCETEAGYPDLHDIEEWKKICSDTGYSSTYVKKIYGELPAPDTDVFPFKNEIMQWMGEYLCVSQK